MEHVVYPRASSKMSVSVCPLCRSSVVKSVYSTVNQCCNCGLVQTQRINATIPQSSVTAYDQGYFAERNDYISRSAEFASYFQSLLDYIRPYKPQGHLLDVGCGPGLLLQVAQARGYHVSGCDISKWASNYAHEHGLDVTTGELESIHYPDKSFDVIIINHTLEHVPQPVALLCEIRRILADSGIVVVGVPNFDSLMAWLMRARWAGLLPDQHLWHFTPRTLQLMLERAGFSIRKLIVQPSTHQHPNWLKFFVLRFLTTIGNALGRGESLLAIAVKDNHVT